MKRYIFLYLLFVITMIAGFTLYASFLHIPVEQETDMMAVNDIVKSVEQNWHDIENFKGNFTYHASVIDSSGQLRWETDVAGAADTLQEAVRRGCAIMDLTVEERVVGKVLIEINSRVVNAQVKVQLANLTVITILLLCLVSLLFLMGIHSAVVKPFKRLESFANKISTGRFEEPLPIDKNNIFGLFTQSFDVMRASLLEARHKQKEAEQAKKELIASLSHDIKTPVTSIKLVVELLLAGNPAPEIAEKLKTIDSKAEQINRLMNDMLHSALEELGELKVNVSSESSEKLRSLFEDADPYGFIKIRPIPQCMVEMDVLRMEQVIGNIITNSYKYASTDIDVACYIDGEFLRIEINDYGAGVEFNAIELLCTKFYRGENAKDSQKDGEGLGLYVANLLMNKMEGGLEVYNRVDGFSVRLILRLSK